MPDSPVDRIRCDVSALRGVDILFRRSVSLVDVPRVGERIQMWFAEGGIVRGSVRDVQWSIPFDGDPTVNIQIELAAADRKRFARRPALPRQEDSPRPAPDPPGLP